MTPSSPPPPAPLVPSFWLWYPLAAGPVAWATHEWICAGIAGTLCGRNVALVRWLTFALTIVALAAALAGAALGWRAYHRVVPPGAAFDAGAPGRQPMMALGGVAVSLVFALAILWQGVSSVLVSDICGIRR